MVVGSVRENNRLASAGLFVGKFNEVADSVLPPPFAGFTGSFNHTIPLVLFVREFEYYQEPFRISRWALGLATTNRTAKRAGKKIGA